MKRVLSTLTDYFEANKIEIVPMPSYSNDVSGIVAEKDYVNFIGESELKKHLSGSIHYRNEEALNNDVKSISAIHILRKGTQFERMENCKAIFVTTNPQLAFEVRRYVDGNHKSAPLAISDLDFITFLWLKNYKNHSGLPTLKLIENARLSLEPTEHIRQEFIKKSNKFNMNRSMILNLPPPTVNSFIPKKKR